jgi:glycolate oxidase FAD binding subunit
LSPELNREGARRARTYRDLAPISQAELADVLADASQRRQALVPWGAGQHQHVGRAPQPGSQRLEIAGLRRVVEYEPADLTITVEAGATLAEVQGLLKPHGQWLAWDPPGAERATLGGLLAAGRVGPLRLGYGTPRDWVLGMRVVLGDGRLVRSGARVVKNVAGYDLHKLHLGALGTLGVIAEVTFKIAPLPGATAVVWSSAPTLRLVLEAAELLRQPPLQPRSLVVYAPRQPDGPLDVFVRYDGSPAAVERQVRQARQALAECGLAGGLAAEADQAAGMDVSGQTWAEFPTPETGTLTLRAGAPTAALALLMSALRRHARARLSCWAILASGWRMRAGMR